MTRDEERKAKKREMDKQERKRDLAYSRKIGGQAISMKKKMRKELREKHKTKTGGQMADDDHQQQKEVVDIIKNPWKHNKNIKKNIQLKMKKQRRNRNYSGGDAERGSGAMKFKSSSGPAGKKYDNKAIRKKMRQKGNKTRFKNRRKR